MSRRITFAMLALLLFLPTAGAEGFGVSLEVKAFEAWGDESELRDVAFTVRHRGEDPGPSLSLDAAFSRIEVQEFYVSWLVLPGFPGGSPVNLAPDKASFAWRNYTNGALEYSTNTPWAAAALYTERIHGTWQDSFAIEGSTISPFISASSINPPTKMPVNPGERYEWRLNGTFGIVRGNTFEGRTDSTFTLYWHESSVNLSVAGKTEQLVSKTWSEPVDPTNGITRQHSLWHVASVAPVSGILLVPQRGDHSANFHYVRTARVDHVHTLASHSSVVRDGQLPAGAQADASAVWVRGNFSMAYQAEGGGLIALNGEADGISIAGGDARWLSAPTAATSFLVVLLGTLVVFGRDVLAQAASRLFVPLYSLLRRDDVLDQPVRKEIHHAIQVNEGITFRQLRDLVSGRNGMKIGNGTLQYHLWRLEQFRLVTCARAGLARKYFDAAPSPMGTAAQRVVMSHAATRAIAENINRNPGQIQRQLAMALGGNVATRKRRFQFHVARLLHAGLVNGERRGRAKVYTPTKTLDSLLRVPLVVRASRPASAEVVPSELRSTPKKPSTSRLGS